jgi:hypothetical protein
MSLCTTRGSRGASVAHFLDRCSDPERRQADFEPLRLASGISPVLYSKGLLTPDFFLNP